MAEYGATQMGGVTQHQLVPAFNLDSMLAYLPRPDVLKIDVEGAEFEVLDGQTRMLEDVRPIVLCEVNAGVEPTITSLFRDARYRLYDAEKPLRPPHPVDAATWSTLAIPEEKASALIR